MNNQIALDTSAYTLLGKGNTRVADLVSNATYLGLPLPVLGEIYFGIYGGLLEHKNKTALSRFLNNDRVTLLQINESTAKIFGEIAAELRTAGKPIQQNDIWIAALCKQHGYSLLTADKGFKHIIGLDVIWC